MSYPDEFYYTFDYDHSLMSVFVLDTRSARTDQSMLDDVQKSRLLEWLQAKAHSHHWKIIASPVSWSNDTADGTGIVYVSDREWLMEFIEREMICGVVIVSGDMHFGGVYRFSPYLHEISASPFQAIPFPYPGDEGSVKHRLFFSSWKFHFGYVSMNSTHLTASVYGWDPYVSIFSMFYPDPEVSNLFSLTIPSQC